MKPLREHMQIEPNRSWGLLWREVESIPFVWHYHPEFELTLTLNCHGQRYIGDQITTFESGDLVLVGPNQPHTWHATEKIAPDQQMLAIVLWFNRDWLLSLGQLIPEYQPITQFILRHDQGLIFSVSCAQAVGQLMQSLSHQTTSTQTLTVLQILQCLSQDQLAQPIGQNSLAVNQTPDRLQKAMEYLHQHFSKFIRVEELAELSALSVGGFHRLFKQSNGCTPNDYQNRLRIGHACQQLISTNKPIAVIAESAGFASLSYFNRIFKQRQNTTPQQFRKQFQSH